MRRTLFAMLLAGALAHTARAADNPADFAWVQHPGADLPRGLAVQGEAGQRETLGAALGAGQPGAPPVVLDLGYYHCPTLCGVVRADLIAALRSSGLSPGRDYRLVALSIDPAETPQDAAAAKQADLAQAGLSDGSAWRYLTAPGATVETVSDTVGFRSRYDVDLKQFLHPAGLVVLTGTGRVSSYLLGVGYTGGDLRAAVLRAGTGGIAQAALPVLLLCFHFDPATGRYTLAIEKLLQLLALLTVLTLGGLLLVLHRTARPR